MTKAKHTPGPWKQSHRENQDGGFRTQVYPANDPENTIATLHWHSVKTKTGFTTDREANALLIAAAPDMYEALVEIAKWAKRQNIALPSPKIYTAIAKAEDKGK